MDDSGHDLLQQQRAGVHHHVRRRHQCDEADRADDFELVRVRCEERDQWRCAHGAGEQSCGDGQSRSRDDRSGRNGGRWHGHRRAGTDSCVGHRTDGIRHHPRRVEQLRRQRGGDVVPRQCHRRDRRGGSRAVERRQERHVYGARARHGAAPRRE